MKLTITSKEKQVVCALASVLLFGGICLLRQEKQTKKQVGPHKS